MGADVCTRYREHTAAFVRFNEQAAEFRDFLVWPDDFQYGFDCLVHQQPVYCKLHGIPPRYSSQNSVFMKSLDSSILTDPFVT